MTNPSISFSRELSRSTRNQNLPSVVESKQSADRAILKLVDTSYLASKTNPLQLVYQAAVTEINERLVADFGPNALDEALESGVDVSPEATARRIVSMSIGFYDAFKENHPDEDEDFVFQNFMDIISDGIEHGFAEAREVLEGLAVLQGDIADDIDETYLLIQDRLLELEVRHLDEDLLA